MPSKPVGLENRIIEDGDISSSSMLDSHLAKYARLNEARAPGSWCSSPTDANSWLQIFLGKQYTLTHIALQGVNDSDVKAITVKYEKTQDGANWMTYSKSVGANSFPKVVFFYLLCLFVSYSEAQKYNDPKQFRFSSVKKRDTIFPNSIESEGRQEFSTRRVLRVISKVHLNFRHLSVEYRPTLSDDTRPISRPILGRDIDRHSGEISTDHWSGVGRHVL